MHEKSELIRSLIFFSSITFALLILLLGLLFITLKNKQQYYNSQLILVNNEFEKNLLKSQIEVQEQTIQTITREIHDNIGLSLTLAKLNLNTLSNCSLECSNKVKINDAINLLSSSILDLSNLSKGINLEQIIENGLSKALEAEVERANKVKKTVFQLLISENLTFMPAEKELIIFRIIQEGINNILKHSNANNAKIILLQNENELYLEIADDGSGISEENLPNFGSGLKNIKARTKILEGTLSIVQNSPGTRILIKVPIVI